MFTFVVSLVVVGGAILVVLAIVQSGEEQPAMSPALRRRASTFVQKRRDRPRRPPRPPRARRRPAAVATAATARAVGPEVAVPRSAPAVAAPAAPLPRVPALTVVEASEPTHRVRSAVALLLVIALVGVALAALVGVCLFVLNVVLRHAANSGALAG